MNLYLLLQVSLRNKLSVNKSRVIGAISTMAFGAMVEILQFYKSEFLGSTYDPLEILMYGIGMGLGVAIDLAIIERFERRGH